MNNAEDNIYMPKDMAKKAAMLFFVSFIIGQIGPILTKPFGAESLFFSVPIFLALYGIVALFIARGSNVAKIIGMLIVCFGFISTVYYLPTALNNPGNEVLITISIVQIGMWIGFFYYAIPKKRIDELNDNQS